MKNLLLNATRSILFLLMPYLGFGQAPSLGTVSSFAVFTSVGAFDNLGASVITGDIGTGAGAFTGFPPGVVIGGTHVADPVSTQAAIDLDLANTFLSGIACGEVIGTTLGSNQVLTPKVYCLGAASTLNGDLYLDGQGNANALFIFKVDGAFSTTVFSKVVLINAATIQNVYWQINGAVGLGDHSTFIGTIIATGAISLLEGASVLGRALTRAGAIDLHNNLVLLESPLPIELVRFTGQCENKSISLSWTTAAESNNDYFTIERSQNGVDWAIVAKIPGDMNASTTHNYNFTDLQLYHDISYYRLKQTDFDAKFKYSFIIKVDNCSGVNDAIFIYPNPAFANLHLDFNDTNNRVSSVNIFTYSGISVYHADVYQPDIDMAGIPKGIYFIVFTVNSNKITEKFILEK